LKKNAHNNRPWNGPGPSSSSKQKTDSIKPPPQTGASKASADQSPGRRGSKRERSPTDTSCISVENRSHKIKAAFTIKITIPLTISKEKE
jgi:hypothetical protein